MSHNLWIAIVGHSTSEEEFGFTQNWWCMPESAKVGDLVLAYRTSRANPKNPGVYALFRVAKAPDPLSSNAGKCYLYGSLGKYSYTEIMLVKKFKTRVPFALLKSHDDPNIREEPCVRQRFQGTIFKISL